MATFYVLNIRRSHAPGELHINDVPVDAWENDVAGVASVANQWIPGPSSTVGFVPRQSADQKASGGSGVEITISSVVQISPENKESRPIGRLQWLQTRDAVPVSTRFASSPVPPSAFWPNARTISLDEAAKASILSLVSELQTAFERRDVASVTAMLDFKAVDSGRAHYHSPESSRESQVRFLSRHFSKTNFKMQELLPEQVKLRLVGGSRLVWITRNDLSPVVQSDGENGGFAVPLYAAPVSGRWILVR